MLYIVSYAKLFCCVQNKHPVGTSVHELQQHEVKLRVMSKPQKQCFNIILNVV